MKILMSPKFAKRLTLALLLTALILTLVSFIAPLSLERLSQLIRAISSFSMTASQDIARHVVELVHVDHEQSIATWFSAAVLLLNSVLLAAISSTKAAVGDKYVAYWLGLSVIFLILSVDEVAGFHDRASILLWPVFRTSGIFAFFWVIPGSVLVLLFVLAYLRFFFALPRRVKWLFLAAGGLYVGGALGVEMVGGYMHSEGADERWKQLAALAEEFLEMTGASVFFYALTGYCEDSPTKSTNARPTD